GHGDAEFVFVAAGFVDMAGKAEEFGPGGGGGAHGFEGGGAVFQDVREASEGFDVVDDGGFGECAGDGRERRLDAGPAAFALERFEQAGLFAADVSAGAAVQVAMVDDVGAGMFLAEDAMGVAFFDGFFADFGLGV